MHTAHSHRKLSTDLILILQSLRHMADKASWLVFVCSQSLNSSLVEHTMVHETELICKLRSRVSDLDFETNTTPTILPEDHFLIRWIRARNHDLNKVEQMLRNYIEWKANNILLHESNHFTPSNYIETSLLHKFTGVDREGRVVMCIPFGRWELRRVLEAGFMEDACPLQYKLLDKLQALIEQQRKLTGQTQFVVVGDSAELTFRKLASYETIQMILRFFREFESYYPELLYSCYIVNTPFVFSYIFNLVKPLLSSHTLSKVQLFDYNREKWMLALKKVLPDESLPVEYGGCGEKIFSGTSSSSSMYLQ